MAVDKFREGPFCWVFVPEPPFFLFFFFFFFFFLRETSLKSQHRVPPGVRKSERHEKCEEEDGGVAGWEQWCGATVPTTMETVAEEARRNAANGVRGGGGGICNAMAER